MNGGEKTTKVLLRERERERGTRPKDEKGILLDIK